MAPSRKRIAQAAVLGTLGVGAVALHRRSRSRKSIEDSSKKELERSERKIQEKIAILRAERNERELEYEKEKKEIEMRQQQQRQLQAEMEQLQKEKDERWQKQIQYEREQDELRYKKEHEQWMRRQKEIQEERLKNEEEKIAKKQAEEEKKRNERIVEEEKKRNERITFYGKMNDDTPEDIKLLLYDPDKFLTETKGEWVKVGEGAYGEVFKRGNIAWKHFKGGKQAMHDECEMHKLVESLIPNHVPQIILCWESRLPGVSGMFMKFLVD